MLVGDVMSLKVVTIQEDATFEEILTLLIRNRISGAPVVNKKNLVTGIISEKDLLFKLFPSQEEFYNDVEYYFQHDRLENEAVEKFKKAKAKNLMAKPVISVRSKDNIMTACALLLIHNIRRLPVIDDGVLVGIVTTRNVYRNFLRSFLTR